MGERRRSRADSIAALLIDDTEVVLATQDQGSFTIIFSLVTTMLGTSLLSLPWAFSKAGLLTGALVLVICGVLCYHTCWLVLKHSTMTKHNKGSEAESSEKEALIGINEEFIGSDYLAGGVLDDEPPEFTDVVKEILGKPGEIAAWVSSLAILTGASFVYAILMSKSLYTLVEAFTYRYSHIPSWWSSKSASVFLIAALYPLTNFKRMTILVSLSSYGFIPVLYLIVFIVYKSTVAVSLPTFKEIPQFESSFFFLGGITLMSYFLHNVAASIVRTHRQPQRIKRDLGLSYLLATVIYLIVGCLGFVGYVNVKDIVIHQDFLSGFNLLKHFEGTTIVAHMCLVIQLFVIFPLIVGIVRQQFFLFLFHVEYPSIILVCVFDAILCAGALAMCVFYPEVGTVLRYTGAFAGTLWIFVLPIAVHITRLRQRGKLRPHHIAGYAFIGLVGISIIVFQFVQF